MSDRLSLPKVRGNSAPKYLQTREILVDAIRSGQLAPGDKLPSTKEIGSLVNVSLITAHRALEDMVDLGYLRREVGRGTYVRDDVDLNAATPRQLSIGLVLDNREHVNIDDFYHATLINRLRKEAQADSCRVEFFFHDRFELIRPQRTRVGAICIHPPEERRAEVVRMAQSHAVVILGGSMPDEPIASVDCDNVHGAREAVRHLLGLGHRRFIVLSGPTNLSNSCDRNEGAVAELRANGIAFDPREIFISRESVVLDEATKVRIERRLVGPNRPTAILAGGFYLALAAMHAVRKAGMSVPRDVSVVGFDDPPAADLFDPPVTTVRQPLEAMASRAYVIVRDGLLGDGVQATRTMMAPQLVIRSSTAAARSDTV